MNRHNTPLAQFVQPNISLEQRYEQLHRTVQTMWALLKSKLNLSDEELEAILTSQGASPKPRLIECGVCYRPMQSTARCCLYCGAAPRVDAAELRSANLTVTRHAAQ
jgi:hypothetical protein